ncbi:MAG: hypothetical protein MJK10_01755 [Pseudomonadales bacterium]|nr:hypothetical protein [Pseudomonadales bacterium]NRA14592.1 hypothetical protein [Oceanospirillaceae bacterium]
MKIIERLFASFITKILTFIVHCFYTIVESIADLPLVFRGMILGPALLVSAISLYQWIEIEFPSRPVANINSERIQHPNYHNIATHALKKFSLLAPADKSLIIKNLQENLVPLEQWMAHFQRSDYLLMCLGESHTQSTRKFLSEAVLAEHNFDALYLEANPQELTAIYKRLYSATDYYPLLDADILQLLRSVISKNPDINIHAIDITDQQVDYKVPDKQSRDDFITLNFLNNFTYTGRNIVLIGAMHCNDSAPWFYAKVKNAFTKNVTKPVTNVRIYDEHEEGIIEAFVFFLDQIGLKQQHFVIVNAQRLPPQIKQWFPLTTLFSFDLFETVIIYRQQQQQTNNLSSAIILGY